MKRTIRHLLIFLCWLALTSCSFNPFTRDNQLTGSAASTGVGAAIGGGTMLGVDASKPLVGVGALAGGLVGYYVSTLRFASGGIIQGGGQVFTVGEYATVEIPTDSLFDTNSSELLPEAEPILKSTVDVLNRYPNNNILVSGNTSGFGPQRYEHRLSEARARQIAAYLWANGINVFEHQSIRSTRKLIYVGYGDFFPISNNIRAKSIRENSRIQITAYPTSAQLAMGKRFKVFNNIGAYEEPHLTQNRQDIDFNKVFPPGEVLPESRLHTRNDFNTAFNEQAPRNTISPFALNKPSFMPENTIPTGEIQGYKNVSTTAHTTEGGNVLKHGGYKGESCG